MARYNSGMGDERETILLQQGERIDNLERGGLRIIQHPEKFRFGLDAVMLAYFAKVKRSQSVLDLGTGTGILPLLLYGRYMPRSIVGIEIQEEMAGMARRSVALNGLENVIEIVEGDFLEERVLPKGTSYDIVVANPPYYPSQAGAKNEKDAHSIARHEIASTLEQIAETAARCLKTGGRFFLVHQPAMCARLTAALKQAQMEPKRMRLVQARADKEPSLLLVEAAKQGKVGVRFEPTLILYDNDGRYTKEAAQIYGR